MIRNERTVVLHHQDGVPDYEAAAREIRIPSDGVVLEGILSIPPATRGVVLFAHGTGSSRHSPRNLFVARGLHRAGMASLLFDLLTREEEALDQRTGHLRFDIELLVRRLLIATEWIRTSPDTCQLRIGYFGASTGAGAALAAATKEGNRIVAVVSRGGRPDLAGPLLPAVGCPTLLIVGAYDQDVIKLNREAYAQLRCERELRVIAGASHFFEEPGTLEEVARLAAAWFQKHLAQPATASAVPSA
ncbi:MAG: dienelactone hydrolase family protein [Acidobacteria bacterium]|nr:dienelactone hydrolase family protein [Acidobacteriota bacterium]